MRAHQEVGDGGRRKPALKVDGIHVGDLVIRPAPAFETDGHLDTPASRERARQKDEDARTAQHAEGDPAHATPAPADAGDDVDASIRAAREAPAGEAPDAVPILLHDPLTGKVIGTS